MFAGCEFTGPEVRANSMRQLPAGSSLQTIRAAYRSG